MENYEFYQPADFLTDEHFISWVLDPDEVSEAYWQEVFAEYPQVIPVAEEARGVLLNIRVKSHRSMPDRMREELVANIQDHIGQTASAGGRRHPRVFTRFNRWVAAACVLLAIGFAVYQYGTFSPEPSADLVTVKERDGQGAQRVSNASDIPLLVLLPDRSTVILDPGAYLVYTEHDFVRQRQVYLFGEAFFEVARQEPYAPFVVTTDHITAKVLGTSFRISALGQGEVYRVIVNTGLVEVTSNETVLQVAANQEAVFEVASAQLSQEPTPEPAPLSQEVVEELFDFQAAPLDSVINLLANRYNVSISISDSELAKRTITASLGELHLYEKLELISKAAEATYTLTDGKIFITPTENQ